jgi:amino acid permease
MDKFNFRRFMTRSTAANALMVLFVLGTTVGAGMILLPAGFIVGGITCGLVGYLLGSN